MCAPIPLQPQAERRKKKEQPDLFKWLGCFFILILTVIIQLLTR